MRLESASFALDEPHVHPLSLLHLSLLEGSAASALLHIDLKYAFQISKLRITLLIKKIHLTCHINSKIK